MRITWTTFVRDEQQRTLLTESARVERVSLSSPATRALLPHVEPVAEAVRGPELPNESPPRRTWLSSRRLPTLIAVLAGAAMIASRLSALAHTQRTLWFDLSSYVLPASSFQSHLGAPYRNYFDIKPPLLLAHLAMWMAVFGESLLSFYALYALWLIAMLAGLWLVLRRLAPAWLALAAFVSATIVMPATGSLDMFFPSEVPGLALILFGLVLIMRDTGRWNVVGAAFLLTAAGQVKDVYVLAPLLLVPVVLSSRRRRETARQALAGAALAAVLAVGYLAVTGSVAAYLGVLDWKHQHFAAPGAPSLLQQLSSLVTRNGSGLMLGLAGALVSIVVVLAAYGSQRASQAGRDPVDGRAIPDSALMRSPASLVLFAWLALAVGAVWQHNPMGGHNAVTTELPTVLAVVAAFHVLSEQRPTVPKAVTASLLLACLLPQLHLFATYGRQLPSASPGAVVSALGGLERAHDVAPFKRPATFAADGRCIQVAYGWAAGAYYHYSRRPSCSRFFLANLVKTPAQITEMRREIATGGPAVVVYHPSGTDVDHLDPAVFQRDVFPWGAVLAACYVDKGNGLFVAKAPDRPHVTACIDVVIAAHIHPGRIVGPGGRVI